MYHAIAGLAESAHAQKTDDDDDEGGCFAAAGTAEVRGRGLVALGELRVGDEVRTGKEQVRNQKGQGREQSATEAEVGGGGPVWACLLRACTQAAGSDGGGCAARRSGRTLHPTSLVPLPPPDRLPLPSGPTQSPDRRPLCSY